MYAKLTKTVKDTNGEDHSVCAWYGTEKCQIHNCSECPLHHAIIEQLAQFEEWYLEQTENEDSDNND